MTGHQSAPSPETRSARGDRVLQLGARLAEKQREIEALQARLAGVSASRGWRVLTVLSIGYGLLRFQAEAYHRAAALWRRAARRVLTRLHTGFRTARGGAAPPPDNASLYARWRAANEPDAAQLAAQRRIAGAWGDRPLISVVSPVFAPPADALADTIASVRAQSYDRWELVLVLAGPQPDSVLEVVRAAVAADARILLVPLETNRGIAANANAGLAQARGAFVAFLDHDDQLAPDALFEVSRAVREDPAVDVVTFDEDKLAADGRTRIDPLFKPQAASPEHLLSINDRMHSVVRMACLDGLDGFASGVDGAQDWDLGLRLLEVGARARHIPRVLYHWRMVPGSAAGDAMAKPWAFEAQRVALQRHLARQGLRDVVVEHPQIGVVRTRWRPSGGKVSIIIPTKDRANLLETCLRSIRERTTYSNYEILVVDTGSRERATAQLYERLAGDPTVRLLHDDAPFNFSRVNNRGAREASGDILVFMNNDVEVVGPDWLEELVRWADRPEVGCVGPKLIYPNGTLQHAGIVVGLGGHGSHVYQDGPADHTWGVFGSVDFYRNYLMLGGACLAVRRDLFHRLGGFDEAYTLCYSDLDLCLKAAAAGHRNVYTPFARLVHHEGGTRGRHFPPGDVLRACVTMYPLVIQGDPYYSPNLSFRELQPTIAVGDDPSARAELIQHIARLFGVETDLECAQADALLGRSAAWRDYRRLMPAAPAADESTSGRSGRLRLLFVTHDLSRSGAPMVLLYLARALARSGHEICVLSPVTGRLREEFEEAGVRVVISPLALEAPYTLGELFAEFDAVLPNTILGWQVTLTAWALGKPVVWLVHESTFGLDYARARRGTIQALAVADEVVFPSRATRELYREFDSGAFSSETYGIDAPVAAHPGPAPAPTHFRVAIVGSVEPRKGQDVLVRALRQLPRSVRGRLELHVVGRLLDPHFVDVLKRLAGPLRAQWHAEVAPDAVISHLAASDVLVCASRDETGPLMVMEAMALGKPIVSTMVGAVPELLEDGVSALLVPTDDAAEMARALSRLVDDAELRARLGRQARRVFEERLGSDRYARAIVDRITTAMAARAAADVATSSPAPTHQPDPTP